MAQRDKDNQVTGQYEEKKEKLTLFLQLGRDKRGNMRPAWINADVIWTHFVKVKTSEIGNHEF